MADQFTEVSSKSWLARITGAVGGVVIGVLLIPGSMWLLSWNESRSVKTIEGLKEASQQMVSAKSETIEPENDQKLIHLSGEVRMKEGLRDPDFGISAEALALSREVDIYQWTEEKSSKEEKKLGGGTETKTTYTYKKKWSNQAVDSSKFRDPEAHRNLGKPIADAKQIVSTSACLGAFRIPAVVIKAISTSSALALTTEDLEKLPPQLRSKAKLGFGGIFLGSDAAAPEVGDQRILFKVVEPGPFSLLARQNGDTLEEFPTKSGVSVLRVEAGLVSAEGLIKHAESENALLTWGLRALGAFLMFIGFAVILKPLSVLGDVIPFLGNMLEAGTMLISVVLAAAGSIVTIAIAWLAVRPIMSIALFGVALLAVFAGKAISPNKSKS